MKRGKWIEHASEAIKYAIDNNLKLWRVRENGIYHVFYAGEELPSKIKKRPAGQVVECTLLKGKIWWDIKPEKRKKRHG